MASPGRSQHRPWVFALLSFVVGGGVPEAGVLVNLIFLAGYVIVPTAAWGQTLGKKAPGIRVEHEAGKPPPFVRVLARETVGKAFSALALGIGFLWIIPDSRKRAWHDKLCGTVVVRTQG